MKLSAAIRVIIIVMTSLMPATASAAAADCDASAIEKPKYTPLALYARVSGLVVASFHVDAAGAPHEILIEGPKLLTPPVDDLIRRTRFPTECRSQDLEVKFRFRLDETAPPAPSVTFNAPNEFVITAGPQPILCVLRSGTRPRRPGGTPDPSSFEDHPASEPFRGIPGRLKPGSISDPGLQRTVAEAVQHGPNFAGRYSLVKFQIGDGPIGAMVVDVRSGAVFRLPQQVAREDYFIRDTGCLDRFTAVNLPGEASPLSFRLESDLLIVRRCIPTGIERSYFRWHRNQWTLLQRVTNSPPPPLPGH